MRKIKNIFMISVVIPIFNTELYIEKAIKSVLIQPQVSEILIIDDGSTDNSSKIYKITLKKIN